MLGLYNWKWDDFSLRHLVWWDWYLDRERQYGKNKFTTRTLNDSCLRKLIRMLWNIRSDLSWRINSMLVTWKGKSRQKAKTLECKGVWHVKNGENVSVSEDSVTDSRSSVYWGHTVMRHKTMFWSTRDRIFDNGPIRLVSYSLGM